MSMVLPLDVSSVAPRVAPRGQGSVARDQSRPAQDEAGALSFSGILEDKQQLQKPRGEGPKQGEQEQVSGQMPVPSDEAGSASETAASSPAGGAADAGPLTGNTAPQAGGQEISSPTSQNMAIPMTELMLRIKTGEGTAPAKPETPLSPKENQAKAPATQTTASATATLEIQPTSGQNEAVPVVGTDKISAATSETTAAPDPSVLPEETVKSGTMEVPGKLPAKAAVPDQGAKVAQALTESESDENAAASPGEASQLSVHEVKTGQAVATDVKVPDGEFRTEAGTAAAQVQVEGTETVTVSTATADGQSAAEGDTGHQAQNNVLSAEQHAAQSNASASNPAAAKSADQEPSSAPVTHANPAHPLDEGSFKVTAERPTSPNQAQDIRQQVVRQLSTSLDGKIGQEKVVLHLNPEKLGQVEIQFVAKGNDLNIVIAAHSGEAEKAIREGIRELADGISDKSTRWQQVDIKVETRGQDADKNDTRNDPRRDQSRRDQNSPDQRDHQHRRPDGRPDWASLRGEG